MVIRAKLPTFDCFGFCRCGAFHTAFLTTTIFQADSREAELLHELAVLDYPMVMEVIQRRKEGRCQEERIKKQTQSSTALGSLFSHQLI